MLRGDARTDTGDAGSVSFAVNPGGAGGFRSANLCDLKRSELGGNSAFCPVLYLPPPGGIPIGSQPPITGTYSGSGVFASSAAQPRSPLPQVPQASAGQSQRQAASHLARQRSAEEAQASPRADSQDPAKTGAPVLKAIVLK